MRSTYRTYSDSEIERIALMRWGIHLQKRGAEFHGACPACGEGDDRWMVWPNGSTYCRVCGTKGWLEERKPKPAPPASPPTPVQLAAAERLQWWQQGHDIGYARGWHDAMRAEQNDYWRSAGITPASVDRYLLGWCPRRTFMGAEEQPFESDAYTIPHYSPIDWSLQNVQWRITHLPPNAGGKYRQLPGLPPATFFTLQSPLEGNLILAEGAKKAIVVGQLTRGAIQVAGWPGAAPGEPLYRQLLNYDKIYLVLDPGAGKQHAIERAVRLLPERIYVVDLPEKIDDAIVNYNLDLSGFRNYCSQARRA